MAISIYLLQQKLTSLLAQYNTLQIKLKSSTSQPSINPIITSPSGTLSIDFQNNQVHSYSINMISNITSMSFSNARINGSYSIWLSSNSGPFIMRKQLGPNIKTNLSGDVMIRNDFIIDIIFNGSIYFLKFTNFT